MNGALPGESLRNPCLRRFTALAANLYNPQAGLHPIAGFAFMTHHSGISGRKNIFAVTLTANVNKKQNTMTTLEIKGDWNITKGKLKQKWATLTDDDLQYAEGKQDELLGRIQKRTGETREAVEKAVKEFNSSCCS